jgi:transposase
METRDFRSLSPAAQEELRRKAVAAVRAGKTRREAAALFGVTRQSLGKWVQAYEAGGEKALAARRRGRPVGPGRLKPWQAAQVVRAIEDRCPDQLKLPFWLWTRAAVGALVRRRFGIRLSVWTVGRYLARWGFTSQKPVRRALERDPEAVRRWLDKKYPAIRKDAKRLRATIYWGDEMGLRSEHQAGTTYGRRGRTPAIPGSGRRFGCNMLSALTNRGRLVFMVFRDRFDGRVFLAFLRRLVRQAGRRVFLIVDSHPVHRSGRVKRWLGRHERTIRAFFLPGYSPELNPDELLNQDVKSNAVRRRRARDAGEMMGAVRGYLRGRQRRPALVRRYFEEEHVRYAAM